MGYDRGNAALFSLCLVLASLIAQSWSKRKVLRERWFVPTELGLAIGEQPPAKFSADGFLTRGVYFSSGKGARDWALFNRIGRPLEFSHHLAAVFPPYLYDRHPEFFPLVGEKRYRPGNGTAYWNPDLGRMDVAAFAADAARSYFDKNPDKPSFSVGVNDALLFGESEETLRAIARNGRWKMEDGRWDPENRTSNKPAVNSSARSANSELRSSISGESSAGAFAWFRERPDYSNLVFTFTNRVAEEIAATHPDKYIGALAYYWAEDAPDFPLHPNVVPFLTADRSQGYDRLFKEEEALLQRRWALKRRSRLEDRRSEGQQKADTGLFRSGVDARESDRPISDLPTPISAEAPPPRLGLYDYLHGQGFLIPRIHTRLLAENLRQAQRIGFTDYFSEMSPNWGLDGPQPWLVTQLLQNPEQSPEVLLEEYYQRHFGPAAVPMRRFFERCERQWMTQPGASYWLKHYRNEAQAAIFPSEVCRELRALLVDAGTSTDDASIQKRIGLVSDAFGVTERFVAMQEARDRLNRLCLVEGRARPLGAPRQSRGAEGNSGGPSGPALPGEGGTLLKATAEFVKARQAFVDYTRQVQEASPLAIGPFQWEDYLRHDPVPNALLRLRALAEGEAMLDRANTAIAMAGSPELSETWALCDEMERVRGISLVRNGALAGPVRPARRIAVLDYGVALPEGWESTVEPVQFQRATIADRRSDPNSELRTPNSGGSLAAARVLRLTGNKETSVYQWATPKPERVHVASVQVRGHVSPGTVVSLTFGFLDGQQQRLELKTLRLPEGDWPEWVTLRLIERSPAGAKWVGIGVRVQNQVGDDWAEVKEFELTAH